MKKGILMTLGILVLTLLLRHIDLEFRYGLNLIQYHQFNSAISTSEEDRIKSKPLIIGLYESPPLAYVNEFNNQSSGIMVDYLSQLATEIQTNHLLKIRSKADVLNALNNDDIDVAFIEKGSSNDKSIAYTQPLCVIKGKILVSQSSGINSQKDMKGHTLIVLQKDNVDGKIANLLPKEQDVRLLEVENLYQAFALLGKGEASGIIGDDMEIAHFINVTNRGSNYRFLKATLYEKEICLAVKQTDKELLSILNKGILELKKKNLIILTQYKWLGDFDASTVDMRKVNTAYTIIMAIILIVTFFSVWNYMITKKVNLKTKELSESREQLRIIIESLQRGIMVTSNDTIIEECNDRLAQLAQVPRDHILGTPYAKYPALQALIDEHPFEEPFKLGKSYYYTTQQHLSKQKKLITIEDYTEKHANELHARQESKMIAIGHLSAGLAHEIRNPLGLIKSYVYVLERYLENENSRHAVNVIHDSITRINKLIENLLRYSRLSNDEYKEVCLDSLVDLMLSFVEKKIGEAHIQLEKHIDIEPCTPIVVNEDVLKMTVLNLINNSIDALMGIDDRDKKIALTFSVHSEQLHFQITDNGCGIDADSLENIFNPFYSTKDSGTGLGLYMINAEIRKHQGRITVDSTPGIGTQFDVYLPMKEVNSI